jgi:hypothetical protein
MGRLTKGTSKALIVFPNPRGPHYLIGWEGGGEVPFALSGLYTSANLAEQAIDTYMKNRSKSTTE